MAGTLKKQLQGYERVAVNVASRFIQHRSACTRERALNFDHSVDIIPLNIQSPAPSWVDWHGRHLDVAKVTCRYGNGLRIRVWMLNNQILNWPVLGLEVQIGRGEHEPKTDISIEGIALYYLMCVTLHMPVSVVASDRVGPFEGANAHRMGGEDFRIRHMEYTFPNGDTLTTEGVWECTKAGGCIVLSEHPIFVTTPASNEVRDGNSTLKF